MAVENTATTNTTTETMKKEDGISAGMQSLLNGDFSSLKDIGDIGGKFDPKLLMDAIFEFMKKLGNGDFKGAIAGLGDLGNKMNEGVEENEKKADLEAKEEPAPEEPEPEQPGLMFTASWSRPQTEEGLLFDKESFSITGKDGQSMSDHFMSASNGEEMLVSIEFDEYTQKMEAELDAMEAKHSPGDNFEPKEPEVADLATFKI